MDNLRQQVTGGLESGYAANAIPARVEFVDRSSKQGKGDFVWLFFFLVGLVAHLGMGFYMVASQNTSVDGGVRAFSDDLVQDINECNAKLLLLGPGRRLEDLPSMHDMQRLLGAADACRDMWCVFNQSLYIPIVSILIVPIIGFMWMLAMYAFPRTVVWVSVITSGVMYVLFGIALLIEGVTEPAIVFLVLAGISFLVLGITAGAVNKAAEHVHAAMVALSHNKSVFGAAFVIELVMLSFLGFTWWFLIAGSQVYTVSSNPTLFDVDPCVPEQWQGASSLWAYQFFYLFWFVSFCDMGKLVVTAMTIGAWFFETPPANGSTTPPAFLALKTTFTTSSGTVAAASLIAGLFDYILEKTSSRYWWLDPGLIVLKCFVLCLQSCIQALTRFAVIAHAFTGESFFGSASRMFQIMKRNFIGAYVTDRVATTVVSVGAQSFSIAMGCLAWFWIDQDNDWGTLEAITGEDSAFGGLTGFLAFLLLFLYFIRRPLLGLIVVGLLGSGSLITWGTSLIFAPLGGMFVACITMIVLKFQGSVMLSTIDTMFVCYALGKENNLGKPTTGGRELVYVMMEDIPEAKVAPTAYAVVVK